MPKADSTLLTRREREIMNAVFALGNRAAAEAGRVRVSMATFCAIDDPRTLLRKGDSATMATRSKTATRRTRAGTPRSRGRLAPGKAAPRLA